MTSTLTDAAGIPRNSTGIINQLQEMLNTLNGNIADWGLETLLKVMELAFEASKLPFVLLILPRLKGFDNNLRAFEGRYVFAAKDGRIHASAVFENGRMDVLEEEIEDWDVKIIFKDVRAFWKFLFAGGNDILDSILVNDVEVYGNLNYLYRFGYMARDLEKRLGLRFCAKTNLAG
ncbi:MAG: hypothetical protein V1792_27680 [Pseudomonadota bacterium]